MRVFAARNPRTAMLYRVSRIFLNFLIVFYCATGEIVSKRSEKLPETKLQICIESFDVHKDKIIRTEDSRKMGAKYLNEIDVESRNDCLRLCCETELCDVFVFEEKSPGSCYLFNCGPPNDFKCKFTNHANYSSAVLDVSRIDVHPQNTAGFETQIRKTQQEHELESLRKLPGPAPVQYPASEPTARPFVTQAPTPVTSTTLAPVKSACRRNQFECRTSGDCIAIYNACDGIPQCADGSDESAELGCPTEKTTLSPPPAIQQPLSPPGPADFRQMIGHRKPYVPLYERGQEKDLKSWQETVSPRQSIPQQQRFQYPAQRAAASPPQINTGSQGYQWEYPPPYEPNKPVYNPADAFHGQNNLRPYEQEQPHIFNHKGPGVVGEMREGAVYVEPNHQYPPYFPPLDRGVWQEGQPQPPPSISLNVPQAKPIAPQGQPPVTTVSSPPCKPNVREEISSQVVLHKSFDADSRKDAFDRKTDDKIVEKVITPEENHETPSRPQSNKTPTKEDSPKKVSSPRMTEEHRQPIMGQFQQESDNDKVLRPKGAVISLALGLTATALMSALLACRLRVVRRRGRRGHGPYTHDADYLVNGMYL